MTDAQALIDPAFFMCSPSDSPRSGSVPANPCRMRSTWVEETRAGNSALEVAPLFLGQPAPDSGVLVGLDSPIQAGPNDLTAKADDSRSFDLDRSGVGVPDGEEQPGVLIQTGREVTLRHQDRAPFV